MVSDFLAFVDANLGKFLIYKEKKSHGCSSNILFIIGLSPSTKFDHVLLKFFNTCIKNILGVVMLYLY